MSQRPGSDESEAARKTLSADELHEALGRDPDKVLREHTGRLRELREEETDPQLIRLIDAVLEDYEEELS